jgi:hypothetical protein
LKTPRLSALLLVFNLVDNKQWTQSSASKDYIFGLLLVLTWEGEGLDG